MSSTKKVDAKTLKVGARFKVPACVVTVSEVKAFDGPSLGNNILVFTVTGNEGPYKGVKTVVIVHSGDKVDKMLNHPWPRRLYDWIMDGVWRQPR